MAGKNEKQKEKGTKIDNALPPRMTYSESARINVGDYEHRELFLSYQDNVQPGETPDDCFNRLRSFTRKKLYAAEKRHRMATRDFVDFDTKAKIPTTKGSVNG